MSEETNLLTFKSISNFVSDLVTCYGTKLQTLRLYKRLLEKTTIADEEPIKKHINAFRKFCVANRNAIMDKDPKKVKESIVKYSDRVFIDMSSVLDIASDDEKSVIWQHLLTISALVDPLGNSKAKELLRKQMAKSGGENEADFLSGLIGKVSESVGEDEKDPMKAMSGLTESGVFAEIVGGLGKGLESGQLDVGKLLGAVQGMVGAMSQQPGMSAGGGGQENPMAGMTSMMSAMFSQVPIPDSIPPQPDIDP